MIEKLSLDPGTWVFAELNSLPWPVSREAAILGDVYRILHGAHCKPPHDPHPLIPVATKTVKRKGDAGGRSRAECEAILAAMAAGRL